MVAARKKCALCQRTQPLSAFHSHPRGKLGVQGSCKKCSAERRRAKLAADGAVASADPTHKPAPAALAAVGVGILSEADHAAVWAKAVDLAKAGDNAMVKLVLSASTPKAAAPAEDPEVSEKRWMRYVLRAIREMRSAMTTEWALQLLERLRLAGPEAAAREMGIELDELAT